MVKLLFGKKYSTALFLQFLAALLCMFFSEQAHAVSFSLGQPITTGQGHRAVTTGHFNNDTDTFLDLAVVNQSSTGENGVSVLLGNGDGTFGVARSYSTGASPNSITAGYFNNDGFLDLAVANYDVSLDHTDVSVLMGNNGSETDPFQLAVSYNVGTNSGSVVAVDFDGDGNFFDLAVANQYYLWILLNKEDNAGTFTVPTSACNPNPDYPDYNNPHFVTTGDFNNNGLPDLAVLYYGGNNVAVLLDGGCTKSAPQGAYGNPFSAITGHFNSDTDTFLDLAVVNDNAGFNNDHGISVLLGNGDGTFQTRSDYNAGSDPFSVTTGDFNGDGKPDLAVADYLTENGNNISVLLGNGDGTFQTKVGFRAGSNPNAVTTGDFTGDEKPDLAVTNSAGVVILLNAMLRIAPSAGPHGSIACSPKMVDPQGGSACTITPDAGYLISDVTVNGSSVGAVSTYNFADVTTDQTISASFTPPATGATLTASPTSPQPAGPQVTFTAGGIGGSGNYEYRFNFRNNGTWSTVQNYSTSNTWTWDTSGFATGEYAVIVHVRNVGSTADYEAQKYLSYTISLPPVSSATLTASPTSPQPAGPQVTFTAGGIGGSGNYEYRFNFRNNGTWSVVQNYSASSTWTWDTTGFAPGEYAVIVHVRNVGSTAAYEAQKYLSYTIQ